MEIGSDKREVGERPTLSGVRIGLLAGGIILIVYVAWLVVVLAWGRGNYGGPGTFGDSFGVVNALFSGLALAAVAVTLWLNQKQLEVQQEELRNSVAEMRGQREQLEAQNAFLAKQATQNQFFQMLASWQSLVEQMATISRPGRPGQQHGRAALAVVGREMTEKARVVVNSNGDATEFRRAYLNAHYDSLVADSGIELGHYFRLLYHIVRFVDRTPRSVLSRLEKRRFIGILRAHLSDPEFVLMMYNGIHAHADKFYPLIEKYDLIQNINPLSIGRLEDLGYYPRTLARWRRKGKTLPGQLPEPQ